MISFVQPAFSDMKSQGLTLNVGQRIISFSLKCPILGQRALVQGWNYGHKGKRLFHSRVQGIQCSVYTQFILVYTVYAPCVVSQHWLLRQWRNIPGHCGNLTFKQIVLCCQLSIDTSCDPLFAGIVDFHQKWNFTTT